MSKGSKRRGWRYQRAIHNHITRDLQEAARREAIRLAGKKLFEDMVDAIDQALAALPDAWFAVKCGVPREVVEYIEAIRARTKKPRVSVKADGSMVLLRPGIPA